MIRSSLPGDDRDGWEIAGNAPSTTNQVSICTRSQAPGDMDDAAHMLQGLHILQPTASDDGGNYQQPQQQFHGTLSVGTATASAHGPLDPVLVAGLENARERMTLLKFEDQIVRFLRNPREPHLCFPPLSSYHRLIVHRLAQRCGLEHQTADYNPFENSSARVVTLFKTAQSAIPRVLLIDLSTDRQAPTVTPASAPRIMMRKRSVLRPGANGGRGNGVDKATPSLEDRERAYAEARARIFGEDNGCTGAELISASSPSSNMASSARDSSGLVLSPDRNVSRHRSRQAAGPDGSRGFDRREGSTSGGMSGSQIQETRSPKQRASINDRKESIQASQQPSAPNAASWKGSKVLWRNREQELNDPDFTRNHDVFRPRGGASSGTGGDSSYHGNRFGSGMRFRPGEFYDRSYDRFYGYQVQTQIGGTLAAPPPPMPMPMASPGRGRYHVAGPTYNDRVDTHLFPRSPHPHYPLQQQQQLNAPPSMVLGRSGYGYPSPQGRPSSASQGTFMPPQANTRPSGFVEDDFPPLGH
ncbi:hypothetical protein PsorP6_009309 [Peronosclerospora sorghi]|uniref:Uncharacterized protein n=1 Tax=Peronosclerospora sorghi TaxID=230839 RepID=A0ACC0VYM5_9STRA|nr:hypothetical protein PsorP6_009309 [Peronosclerospora sorghi]